MGQGSVKTLDAGVVDETFEGLTKPHEVHAMGRPDIAEGRPGDVLVEAVRRFADAGGFADLRERRESERRAAEAKPVQPPLPDFRGGVQDVGTVHEHGVSEADGD